MSTRARRSALWLAVFLVIAASLPNAAFAVVAADWWRPAPGSTWQIQISSTPKTILQVDVYDIDLFETSQSVIDQMHGQGIKVICYFSAGSYENWRPDKAEFPPAAIGRKLGGWPGERWLDIRSTAVRDIMQSRIEMAASKHCDAVDPDNVDGYSNRTGFDLTAADQLDYNRWLADTAHMNGLAVGLKNDVEQIPGLIGPFDFAVNEECFKYHECDTLRPFTEAGKPVFQIEYGKAKKARRICPQAQSLGFATLIKKLNLGADRIACDA